MSTLKIVFLGTGSGRPTLRRNVSAVTLRYGPDLVLFDCGECTQVQAIRAGIKVSRLVAVCISHFHGDHINGLPGFIGTLGLNERRDPLTIVGPRGLPKYFRALRELSILHPSFPIDFVRNDRREVFAADDFRLTSVPLDHRLPAHGFIFRENDLPGRFDVEAAKSLGVTPGPDFGRLQRGETLTLDDGSVVRPDQVMGETRSGRSVAYIPDTRPSEKVVEAVRGVDVLIHEATYLHEFASDARARGHSTVREAAEVAAEAGVGRLILTHISPKHTRRRELLDEARQVFDDVDVAEDLAEYELSVPA